MFVSVRKKEGDYLLVTQCCLLLLSTRHTEVIGMPGDTFLNPCFLKRCCKCYYKEGVRNIIKQNQMSL